MMTSVSVASLELRMSVKSQGDAPARSFWREDRLPDLRIEQKELYGQTSQANGDYFWAWYRVLWSMDFIPLYVFVDSGVRRKRLESVGGSGCVFAPDRAYSNLGMDQHACGRIRDKQVKKIRR